MTLGIYPSPPKVFWNAQGEPVGLFIEVGQEIARLECWELVKPLVMLAHQIGVKATAEGLASEDQRLLLQSLGWDLG